MINRLVVFGATGDLNARYLLPGLAALRAAGHLPDGFQLVCADRKGRNDQEFREWTAEQLDRHAGSAPADARKWVADAVRYRQADATDAADLASSSRATGRSPSTSHFPVVFPGTITALRGADLPPGGGSSWRNRSAKTWTPRGS